MKRRGGVFAFLLLLAAATFAQQPGPNVNVLPALPASNARTIPQPPGTPPLIPPAFNLTDFLRGDGYQQRQVEPSIAASSYNPDHIVAVYGDYRTVALPESTTGTVTSTGWMGISRSYDRGQTWYGGLIPGFPQDTSAVGQSSPLYRLNAGSDATIVTTPGGHFYIGGLFWTTGGISNVAVVHYRDVPDTEGGDTIRYQGAAIVDKGSVSESGNFTDKPGIAADIARGTNSPTVCGPVYIAYTIFTGGTTGTPFVSKVGFSRSRQGRCGTAWDTPDYLNKSYKQNQGAALAVDPTTGKVYVIWRHIFQAGGDGYPNSILMVVSNDGGATFSSPVPITPAGWSPYDQIPISTSNTGDPGDDLTFRSNAFPTIAIDGNGNVYVASQETVLGTAGYYEPRIVVRTMKAGSNAFTPVGSFVNLGRGAAQQVMPQLTFGAGILKALWYDFRDQNESSTNVSTGTGTGTWAISGVDRQVKTYVAQVDVTKSSNFDGNGNPIFGSPVVVSQYLLNPYTGQVATVPGTELPAVNRPNLPMYVNGSTPFEGDYIGLQTASPFVPNTAGSTPAFRWATQPSDYAAGSAYAAWTDSRDVIFPSYSSGTPNLFDFSLYGWSYYAPPGTGNSCYNQGSRDANIYFSEVKPGVISGSPSLNRQLVSSAGKPIERDFPLYVQNPNATTKYFVLSFTSGASTSVEGSFEQGKEMTGQVTTTDITVLPLSTVTATVFVYCATCTSSTPFAPFSVSVTETDSNFNPIANPIRSQVTFDNDPSAPLVNNIDTELHDVTVSNAQFSNPQYATPQYATPQYATADFSNPQYATPQYATTGLSGDLTPVGDFIWTVQDVGNTASAYLSLTNVAVQSLGSGYTYQVIISRAYNFPYTNTCNSQSIPVDQIISVISNPQYATPQYATPQYATPQYATAQYGDATFAAFPPTNAGSDSTIKMPRQTDFVYIVLRVYRSSGGTTPLSALEITNFLNNISQTVYPQAAPVSPTKGTTTLSLGSSANPSVQGSTVTFTATLTLISNPANATPGGAVTFYDGATQLGSGNVSSNVATFSTSALTPGLHTIVAKYAGDPNFLPSTAALGQTVLAVSTITLVSSQNPSVYGQPVTFTATLIADFTHFTPTGTVTFYVDGNPLDSGPVDPTTHQITYVTSTLTVGSHQIYVIYSGDPNFSGCTSTAITQTVNQASTTTGLLVSPSNPVVGQTLTLLATVTPAYSGIPTGTVTFKATQNVGGGMGTMTLGTVQLDNTGHAQKSVSTGGSSGLTAGQWTCEADYNGDGNFTTSVGTQQVVIVTVLVITSSNLPSTIVGVGYGPQQLSATGGTPPYCWSNSAGTCPTGSVPIGNNGFLINAAGQITGIPQHMGTSQFVSYVSDSGPPVQTASGTITIIVSGPIITAMALPNGTVGSAYPNTPLTVTGGIPPLNWTISSGSLPSGMGLSLAGAISGTPTASGTFNFTAMVTDANGNTGTQGFTVLVSPAFGDLIVADGPQGSPQVLRINPNGLNSNVVATISGGGPSGLANAVAVDPNNGTIYVADPFNARIVKVTPFGVQSNFFVGPPLQNPVALAVDSSGNVYAGDNVANAIFKFNSGGASLGQFAAMPASTAFPDVKMAFDSNGNLIVASDTVGGFTGVSEIDRITPTGTETVVYNSNNNTNTTQAVTSVSGLAIAPSGDYFVEDLNQSLLLDVSNPGTLNMNVTVVASDSALGLVLLPSNSNTVFDLVSGTKLLQTSVPGPTTTTLINGAPLTVANDVALYRPQSLPSWTITANASGPAISTLSGAEGVAANLQTGDVFLDSHSDPGGNNVQLGVVHPNRMAGIVGNSTALSNCDGTGIAIDPLNGQIIVADQNISATFSRIELISTPSSTVSTLINLPWTMSQNNTCQQQYAVAQTASGVVLYFWDNTNAGLYKLAPLTSTGTLSGPIVSLDTSHTAGQHSSTTGNHIAFDAGTGTLLLSDGSSGSVFEVNPVTSSMTTLFSGVSTGVDLSIALKSDTSQVFVQQGNSIYVGPRSGGTLTLVANGFTQLTNIFLAPAHNVWFTEFSGNRIGKMNLGLPTALYAVDKSTNTVYEIVETGGAPATGFTEFTIPTSFADAIGITAGPDGNLWFAEEGGNKIASMTPTGTFTEYTLTTANSTPFNITSGPDGNIWFTENANSKIGVITPGSSTITEYTASGVKGEGGITAGPDGNVWFTASCGISALDAGNCVGNITPGGTMTTSNLSNSTAAAQGIVAGPDGNLWFTEESANNIGKITPGGAITEYPVPTSNAGPYAITAGPDGNLWFTEANVGKIGRITPTGTFTEFATSASFTNPQGITVGPDGNIWFGELSGNSIGVVQIGSPNKLTEFPLPFVGSFPFGITAGP